MLPKDLSILHRDLTILPKDLSILRRDLSILPRDLSLPLDKSKFIFLYVPKKLRQF